MREIKFRAWDKNKNLMYYGVENAYDTLGVMKDNSGNDLSYDWQSFSEVLGEGKKGNLFLMQFTGLMDKNGKEIYEGDIVKVNDDWEVREIKWGFTSDHSSYMYQLGWNLWEEEVFEIIGNIYENPGLLK